MAGESDAELRVCGRVQGLAQAIAGCQGVTERVTADVTGLAALDRISLRRLIEEQLCDSRPPINGVDALPAGITGAITDEVRQHFPSTLTPSAVLVPIVDHDSGLTVLLTHRASTMRTHAGQIAFPGGRVESSDAGPLDTALRETEEEIGLSRDYITFAGYLAPHLVLTGFWITPVVGFVQPGFDLKLDEREVAGTFEVPLAHILDLTNHRARERVIGETSVQVYDIPFEEHNIWGATAGILMSLYRMVLQAAHLPLP